MQLTKFRCHVTLRNGAIARVELSAADRLSAVRAALLSFPGAIKASARSTDPHPHADRVLGDLAVRMSGFPLICGVAA
jgi:hypothetical protein